MSDGADLSSLDAWLGTLAARGAAVRGILPIIGLDLKAAVSDVYDAEGPGWDKLSDKTLKKRRKGGVGANILRDTGIMAGSTDVAVGDDWVEAFAGVSYAEYHARGQGVPKRNPFDLGPFEEGFLADAADLIADAVAQ